MLHGSGHARGERLDAVTRAAVDQAIDELMAFVRAGLGTTRHAPGQVRLSPGRTVAQW